MGRFTRESEFDPLIMASIESFDWPGLNKDQVFAFVKSVIGQESAFRPDATRGEVGGNASIGLMQLLFTTARGLGYPGAIGDRATLSGLYAPGTNIFLGVKFIRQLLDRTGADLAAIASAYNGGYRPDLGFGAKLKKDIRLCLAKDTSGNCTRWFDAKVGQFGNQPHVDAVMNNYAYFFRTAPPVSTINTPQPPLTVAEVAKSPLPWILLAAIGALAFLAVKGAR